MSENKFFPRLFSTLQVGSRTLRNRIALPATLTNYGAGHRVTERWTNFLAERAKGGAGMIVVNNVDGKVLGGTLGLSPDELERLTVLGVIGTEPPQPT